jgi:2-methylcitrate dehydratase PrpD
MSTTEAVATQESAEVFAAHAAGLSFDQLPPPVVERTKLCILDTIAVMIAGSGTPDIAALHRIVSRWGGTPESTAISYPERLPAYSAVLLNGAMGHQYDFDDTHDTAVCHPTNAALSCALAAAEAMGGVSGRDLITAVACGVDLTARLAGAIDGTLWDYPWVRAPVVGIFGATLAAGKVLRLDADQLLQALGLALPQAAGTLQCLRTPDSSVRGMRDGLIYKDAMLAALMAAEGLRGDAAVFDGEYGLYNAYFRGEYDPAALVYGLGERYEGMGVSLKPWPSCRHTHGTLTALLELIERADWDLESVQEVVIHVGDGNRRLCDPVGPEFNGRMGLLCNLPFIVAVALAYGGVPLAAFSADGLSDTRTQTALKLVRTTYDPAQNRYGTIEPGHVEIRLRDGTTFEQTADRALGHPDRPMTRDQVAGKLRDVAGSARRPLDPQDIESLIESTFSCEDVADVSVLPAFASGASR